MARGRRPGRPRATLLLASTIVVAGAIPARPAGATHTKFTAPLPTPPVLTSSNLNITMAQSQVQILPGAPTTMWTYNGTFPGPTIRRPAGQATTVTFTNDLPAAAGSVTVHNHGGHNTSADDGQPDAGLIPGGASRAYTYDLLEAGGNERGATQFYHDHRMDVSGRNVWNGLAGFFIIDDPADPQTLPGGDFDVPLSITDRQFDANNQIPYTFNSNGVTGDHILVNGAPQPYFDVGDRKYRLRVLNASNAREYNLTLSSGQAFTQIGTDSGLLPAPVSRTSVRLMPGERADLVVDFAGRLGQSIVLDNTLGSGSTAEVMQFRVTRDVTDDSTVSPTLRPLPDLGTPTVTRTWSFGGGMMGSWTINGLTFDPNRVDARPVLGTTEEWVFTNPGGMMGATHAVHVHDADQQLISRNGNPPAAYELTKETWRLAPGDEVRVKLRFTDHTGRFVLHCHVLEHEDSAQMAQFEVVP